MSSSLAVIERHDIIEGEWLETAVSPSSAMPSLAELLERFLAALDVRENSKATYARQLQEFTSWLEQADRALWQMKREDILAYREHLRHGAGEAGRGLSAYSVGGYLTAVRRFFAWLEGERIYPNIARDIKGPKRPRGYRKDTLSAGQLRDCLKGLQANESLSQVDALRDYAIFNLMARTGLRDIEVARARVGDISRIDGQAILFVHGKGRDAADEFVLLTSEAEEPIRAYLKSRGRLPDEAPLFASSSRRNPGQALSTRSISRVVKNALRAVGLDDSRLTAHSLRHTAVTLAVQGGASLEQAQAMARHASPATTMVYFHNLNRVSNGAERFIQF